MELKDFPPEAQDMLKGMTKYQLNLLTVPVRAEADADQMEALPEDPGEAINSIVQIRRAPLPLAIEDPLDFIESAVEVVRSVLGHELDGDSTHRAMWEMLTAAGDVLHDYRKRDREVRDSLRAAWLKQRDTDLNPKK
jgi:hypothetical protein